MQPLLGTVDERGFVWTVPRQQFVKFYVATGDAKASGRDAKLPSEDTPEELLQDASIKDAIAELHELVLKRVYESADTITARYSNIAEGDITDYFYVREAFYGSSVRAGDVQLRDWRDMPKHMRQRIKKLKVTGTNDPGQTNFEIELHDPMKANDMLVKLLGLDKTDGSGMDAKSTADAIHAFFTELDQIDDHYIDPDSVD